MKTGDKQIMKFEVISENCIDAINKANNNKKLCKAIARAKEITIDIYGNAEFVEAAEFSVNIQELAPLDANVIFRIVPENTNGSKVKIIFTIL